MGENAITLKSKRLIRFLLKLFLFFLFLVIYTYLVLKFWEVYFSGGFCCSLCGSSYCATCQEQKPKLPQEGPKFYNGYKSSKILPTGKMDILLLSGTVTRDGRVTLSDDWSVVANGVPDIFRYPQQGDYLLQFLDRSGQVLFEYPFDVSFKIFVGSDRETDTSGFTFGAPYYPETKRVVIKYRGAEVASRTVSEHKPTIRVISPNGGERYTDSFTIRWEASDADGGTLYYDVSISPDGGQSWTGYSPMQTEGTTAFFDLTRYIGPRGSNCLIRVQVTDGFNTSEDVSDKPFTIAK